jgi:hypothetical protein
VYNFKANKALCLCNFRLLKKQHLALKGPVSTSSSRGRLIIDIGTDVKTDIETVMEWLLPYYIIPIAAKGKLSLKHRKMEAVRDRHRQRD